MYAAAPDFVPKLVQKWTVIGLATSDQLAFSKPYLNIPAYAGFQNPRNNDTSALDDTTTPLGDCIHVERARNACSQICSAICGGLRSTTCITSRLASFITEVANCREKHT